MAYPRARGENPLNYEEYDPTPFSGGYDQVALYGRPKSPSAETCYPISEYSHHETGGYGEEATPYCSGKPPGSKHGVDEDRPSLLQEDPPHGSDDYSYGRPKPKPSTYEEGGAGYGSGYGGSSGYGSGYGEGGQEFGSGYQEGEEGYGGSRPKPGFGGGGFGRPHGDEGYGGFGEKPGYEGEEGGYGGHRPPRFGDGFGEGDEGGFGGGRRPGRFGGEEGYGGGDRPSYFGDEPPPPPADEGFGGYQGEEHRHGHHHKHQWRHDDE